MITLRRAGVAGSYRGERQGAALTLRVDVGLAESLDTISGDLEFAEGGQFTFHHSFQTTALVQEDGTSRQILRGPVKVHRENIVDIGRLDLEIPDEGELVVTYTLYRLTQFGRQEVATFTFPLQRTSNFFRRVELEVDQIVGVPLPAEFRTDQHPDTPTTVSPQTLTFDAAYRQAGVELVVTLGGQDVAVDVAGADGVWSDEELHGAMTSHFAQHRNEPQWRLYLLLATRYEASGVLGIMFDSEDDSPRQGAAVFANHPAIANAAEIDRNREYLYTIVHELGHAFNLLHAFQKGIFSAHGVLPRPASLSWMNYPQLFPFGYAFPPGWDGSSSFWTQFAFQFDRDELAHLRHNDSLEVIMGGRSFGFAGHLEERPFESPSAEPDASLTLWLPPVVEFMQQLEGDVRLRNDSAKPLAAPPGLHPAEGFLDLLIRRPNDRYPKVYRHIYSSCVRATPQTLEPGAALYRGLSPSFGLRHWFFDDPGTYEAQAVCRLPDGRRLISQVQRVRVLLPGAEADRLAPDFFGTDPGVYFALEGSRIDAMQKAQDTLAEVKERMPKTAIARQIVETNAMCDARVFKDVHAGRVVKSGRVESAGRLLESLGVTPNDKTVKPAPAQSHLRINRCLRMAAQAYAAEGQVDQARVVLDTIRNFLVSVKAPRNAGQDLAAFAERLEV